MSSEKIVGVAVPLPLHRIFSYKVPSLLAGRVAIGMRVLVPFGRRRLYGFIVEENAAPADELKEIFSLCEDEVLFSSSDLQFFTWIADYYLHPLGEVLRTALPCCLTARVAPDQGTRLAAAQGIKRERWARFLSDGESTGIRGKALSLLSVVREERAVPTASLRARFGDVSPILKKLQEKGLLVIEDREVYRDPFAGECITLDFPRQLNAAQEGARAALEAAVASRKYSPWLLHGVTGSGKTEVYLQAIAHARSLDLNALVLVPEISLTPQLVQRFRQRFESGIAVLHSGLSDGERYDEWRRIRRGEACIVIGARSALFAPLRNLGIVVVDEEHEGSYKQGDGLKYNARDMALVRGKLSDCTVVLGSATPLVTTWAAAESGSLGYLPLPDRVRNLPMPEVRLVDMRGEKQDVLSPTLTAEIQLNYAGGGQALVFINRRGFATYLLCRSCGEPLRCPNCSVTLTYHQGRQRHLCHYCDYAIPSPSVCPLCQGGDFAFLGKGTERVEEELQRLLPAARIARMDRDTTTGKGSHGRLLNKVEKGEIDLLVGTQMIAKGHDFPGVTLVGVVSADETLNIPDFRSAERTFQLMTQVLGRAGRGSAEGRVVIQTMAPEHYAISHAVRHDYAGFCREELAFRQGAGYPPYSFLALFALSGILEADVIAGAEQAAAVLRGERKRNGARAEILGPAPAPLSRVRGRYRWQLLIKTSERSALRKLLVSLRGKLHLPKTLRWSIDLDPVDML